MARGVVQTSEPRWADVLVVERAVGGGEVKTEIELKQLTLQRLEKLAAERYGSRAFAVASTHSEGQDPLRAKAPWIRALLAPEQSNEAIQNLEHELWARGVRERFGLGEPEVSK